MPEPTQDEKRYKVELEGLKITCTNHPDGNSDFNDVGPVVWHNLKYEGVVLIQYVMLQAQMELNKVAMLRAKEKGQGQVFEEMGIEVES